MASALARELRRHDQRVASCRILERADRDTALYGPNGTDPGRSCQRHPLRRHELLTDQIEVCLLSFREAQLPADKDDVESASVRGRLTSICNNTIRREERPSCNART